LSIHLLYLVNGELKDLKTAVFFGFFIQINFLNVFKDKLKPGYNVLKESNEFSDSLPCGLYFFVESFLNENKDSPAFKDAGLTVLKELGEILKIHSFSFVESDTEDVNLVIGLVVRVWLHCG
jgi:hypothetical protein